MKMVPFLEAFTDVSRGNKKIPSGEMLEEGQLPVIDQGAKLVAGYTNDPDAAVKSETPLIVFGDHTKVFKLIQHKFAMGADGIKLLKPSLELDSTFAYHYLRSIKLPDAGYSRHFKFLKERSVPLPPLDEQRRIAAILDKADAIRQKRRQAIAHLDTLTQAIFHDMFDSFDGGRVPLSDIGQWHSGGTPPKTGANYYSGDIPWFKSGDLGRINPQLPSGHISSLAISDTAAKLIEPNSILVGMYDTAAMKSSIATFSASCNQAVAFSWIDPEKADIVFIYYAIQSVRAKTLELRRGIRQKNLNLSMIKSIMIPFPSRDNQARFANAVDQIHSIERKVASIEADALYQSLQSRAFRGEL